MERALMTSLVKRTLKWDLLRSIPLGFMESIGTTFGILVLVRVFQGDQFSKAWVAAAAPIGLLLSLLVVQLVRRSNWSVNLSMSCLHFCSAFGFALIALNQGSLTLYVLGMLFGGVGLAGSLPLMSQIYQEHYPNDKRGKLFSYGGFVRKVFAIIASFWGGFLLQKNLDNFRILFGMFSAASLLMSYIALKFDPVYLESSRSTNLFTAFRHVKTDRDFRALLTLWMFLGLGNMLGVSLFIEYVSNRVYGYDFSEFSVGMITTFVPETIYLLTVLLWGRLFDKWNFYFLRVTLNLLFVAGLLIFYLGDGTPCLVLGIAIHGIAKSGGNVVWSLWINKLAPPKHVAEYMSVHTFLTGCRGIAAPFIALPLALVLSPKLIVIIGVGLILLSTLMILPFCFRSKVA